MGKVCKARIQNSDGGMFKGDRKGSFGLEKVLKDVEIMLEAVAEWSALWVYQLPGSNLTKQLRFFCGL